MKKGMVWNSDPDLAEERFIVERHLAERGILLAKPAHKVRWNVLYAILKDGNEDY